MVADDRTRAVSTTSAWNTRGPPSGSTRPIRPAAALWLRALVSTFSFVSFLTNKFENPRQEYDYTDATAVSRARKHDNDVSYCFCRGQLSHPPPSGISCSLAQETHCQEARSRHDSSDIRKSIRRKKNNEALRTAGRRHTHKHGPLGDTLAQYIHVRAGLSHQVAKQLLKKPRVARTLRRQQNCSIGKEECEKGQHCCDLRDKKSRS